MLFTKQRACAQKADASHHAAYHLGRINREMRIGRTIAEFEYSDRQCARRKGDEDERPEIDRLAMRSEEHKSELQSLMRISYDVFCLTKKRNNRNRID